MDEREKVIEEVRAAFSAAFLTGSTGGAYLDLPTTGGGCDTCGHGSREAMCMSHVSQVLDTLKKGKPLSGAA